MCVLIFFSEICIDLKYLKLYQAWDTKEYRAEKGRTQDFLLQVLYLISAKDHISYCPVQLKEINK